MSVLRKKASFWDLNSKEDEIADFFPKMVSDLTCDICVIGGGITGVTLAYELASQGRDVVLLEADHIGSGTSGGTSAHLDPLTDLNLSDLAQRFGNENARKILDSNFKAMERIENNVKRHAMDCEYEKVPGVFLAESKKELHSLEEEFEIAKDFNLSCRLEGRSNSPFSNAGRLVFEHHARFNPLAYLFSLAKAAKHKGARIYQRSRVKNVQEGKVFLNKCSIKAQHIVMATHMPLGLHPILQSRVFPYRSYVIGVRIENNLEDALFWDLKDPYHYIRKAWDAKGEIAIIGGEDHKPGKSSEANSYGALAAYARERFSVKSVEYAWSSEYYQSADGMPYIGKISSNENIYVATGYEGNGLTFGTVAGQLLSDLILERDNPCFKIYSPSRVNAISSGKRVISENAAVVKEFIQDRFEKSKISPFELEEGEGKIVNYKGEQLACYKDRAGRLHALSPVCRHAKCHVKWNNTEESWDCPCHGGRYSATGEVILGPPTQDLKNMDYVLESEEGAAHP